MYILYTLCKQHVMNYEANMHCNITLRNMVQTNGNFLLIGAQQKTYRARRGRGTCWIISARNLKSSMLHMKYKESSTVDSVTKISW